jgi:hypothetical protein
VLPEEHGLHQYRIKSLIEPYERLASEHELSEAGARGTVHGLFASAAPSGRIALDTVISERLRR